jgi:hypothetical protein
MTLPAAARGHFAVRPAADGSWQIVDVLADEQGLDDVVATVTPENDMVVVFVPGSPELRSYFPTLSRAVRFLEDTMPRSPAPPPESQNPAGPTGLHNRRRTP